MSSFKLFSLLAMINFIVNPAQASNSTILEVINASNLSKSHVDGNTTNIVTNALMDEQMEARRWLKNLTDIYDIANPIGSKISWLIVTEAADDSEDWAILENLGYVQQITNKFSQQKIKKLGEFNWHNFSDESLKRSFRRVIGLMGESGLKDGQTYELQRIKSHMSNTYSRAKITYNDMLISLDPEISLIMEKSRDYDELAEVWKMWRDATGKSYAHEYPKYIELKNEATRESGFKNYGEFSTMEFDSKDLSLEFDEVYGELEELYRLLHAYTKKKLVEVYPERLNASAGPMPAHVFGDLWAQQWHNIYEDIKPYKDKPLLDITPNMRAKNLTVLDMVRISEDFFKSLGMGPLPDTFWKNSIFEKPTDGREINCHASAWDFQDGKDFRIKMCAEVTMNDLYVMHHEMGHIYYYMYYKDQPFQFKNGANPGFHEAIGDTMTLSVMTPKHLKQINLLDQTVEDEEQDINFLLFSALRNIALAPFALVVEKWRWAVYSGETTQDTYNIDWWRLKCKYQGIVPPVGRTENDFDPGSKYHIAASVPYDRYFVSLILTFQFHEALCLESGHKGPLHTCDIYQSKSAGKKLSQMMQKGYSEPWTDVLSDLTDGRQNKLDPSSMLEYFRPLTAWLKKQNLTDVEWDCESYIDVDRFLVKSYDGQWVSAGLMGAHVEMIVLVLGLVGIFVNYLV